MHGKELQTALADVYDYGARFYDPVIGRWNVLDPLAEKYNLVSPYNYTDNNPVNNTDPNGMEIFYGAAAQALFGQLKQQPYNPPQEDKKEQKACELEKQKQESLNFMHETLLSINKFMLKFMEFKMFAEGFAEIAPSKLIVSPRAGFSVNSSKFDYFFGKVVAGDPKNIARSAQNLKYLTKMGITNESRLTNVFNQALSNGKVISTKTTEYGTTIMRSVNVGNNGSVGVGFFYKGGNMSATPSVTTIIPKTW